MGVDIQGIELDKVAVPPTSKATAPVQGNRTGGMSPRKT